MCAYTYLFTDFLNIDIRWLVAKMPFPEGVRGGHNLCILLYLSDGRRVPALRKDSYEGTQGRES